MNFRDAPTRVRRHRQNVQVATAEERMTAWRQAADDAGIEADAVHLFYRSRRGNYGAMHYPPGMWAMPLEDLFDLSEEDRAEIHRLRGDHVVVVDDASEGTTLALLLRHEAEHIRQEVRVPASGPVAARMSAALRVGSFYFAMPHERDADAAATRFLRALGVSFDSATHEGDDRLLYDAPWPEPEVESLARRMLAFVLLLPDFDLVCRTSQTFPEVDPDELLEALVPGATAVRRTIGDAHATALQEIAARSDHDEESWGRLHRKERRAITDDLLSRVLARETEVVAEVDETLRHMARERRIGT